MPADTSIYANQNNPLTQMGDLVGIAGGIQRNQLLATETQKEQMNIAKTKLDGINEALASGYQDGTKKGMTEQIKNLVTVGFMSPTDAVNQITQMPNTDGMTAEQEKQAMQAYAYPHVVQGNQIDRALGAAITVANGQTTTGGRVNPKTGGLNLAGPSVQQFPPPTTPTVDANGRPMTIGAIPGASPTGAGGGSVAQNITQANAGIPPIGPNGEKAMAPGPANLSANNNPGSFATGLAPGTEEAMKGSGEALVDTYKNDAGFNGRQFQLQQAITALKGAQTGKGTEGLNNIKSVLLSLSPEQLTKLGITPDQVKVADYDKAQKYLTQYALGFPGAGRSDTGLMTALTGNASTHINNMAAQDVAKYTLGMERMNHQMISDFQQSGLPPAQFNTWRTQHLNDYEPSAYAADQFDKKQLNKYLSGLSPAGLDKWKQNYNNGVATGTVEHKYGE